MLERTLVVFTDSDTDSGVGALGHHSPRCRDRKDSESSMEADFEIQHKT